MQHGKYEDELWSSERTSAQTGKETNMREPSNVLASPNLAGTELRGVAHLRQGQAGPACCLAIAMLQHQKVLCLETRLHLLLLVPRPAFRLCHIMSLNWYLNLPLMGMLLRPHLEQLLRQRIAKAEVCLTFKGSAVPCCCAVPFLRRRMRYSSMRPPPSRLSSGPAPCLGTSLLIILYC